MASLTITEPLYVASRAEFRQWLELYHDQKTEIWLLYPLKETGMPRIPYDDAVEEAICFGWIDGLAKRYDAQFSAQRFTPRQKKTNWSELNKHRARLLLEQGLLHPAGMAVLPDLSTEELMIAPDILEALQFDPEVWTNFQAFPDYYQRIRIGFIEEARKHGPMFTQRLGNFIKNTKANKRFGTVR